MDQKGYGIAQFPDIKADPDTLYYTGSTTKSFTAAAVSLLIDDSAGSKTPLQWNTPIASIIPDDFVLLDNYATNHLTLEDALSHRTGMPRHDGTLFFSHSPRDVVRNLRFLPLSAEPRTTFQYCNIMFVTIAHVIETITDMWLGDFFRTRIWEPLGMDETYFSLDDAEKAVVDDGKVLARGYYWEEHVEKYVPELYLDWPMISGAGGIISSVNDYARYLRAMMDEALPISLAGYEALHTPRMIVSRERAPKTGPTTYSLGWDQKLYQGESLMTHDGGLPGFGSQMLYMPWHRWGVVMMANTAETSNAAEQVLAFRLMDDLLQTPMHERTNWVEVMDHMLASLQEDLQHAKHRLFPNAPPPEQAIPPSLAPEEYTGSYIHPAYGKFNLTLHNVSCPGTGSHKSPLSFHAALDMPNTPWAMDLEHVNVDFFLVTTRAIKADNVTEAGPITKAEFALQANGKVKEVGVQLEPAISDMVWFEKVA